MTFLADLVILGFAAYGFIAALRKSATAAYTALATRGRDDAPWIADVCPPGRLTRAARHAAAARDLARLHRTDLADLVPAITERTTNG